MPAGSTGRYWSDSIRERGESFRMRLARARGRVGRILHRVPSQHPFVLSLSKHRPFPWRMGKEEERHFDRLSANGRKIVDFHTIRSS
jgi:hypothetical protein